LAGLKAGVAKVAIVATLPIKEGSGSQFEDITLQLLDQVQTREAGNLLYCLAHDTNSPNYVFTELYTDMGAIGLHGKTSYFKDAGQKQGPHFAGRPTFKVLEVVGSGGAKPTFKLKPRL
jgi:quinol monooxygenase YgiN